TVEQLAAVSVKNRLHGSANPNAVFRSRVSLEDVTSSPMIASPLTRNMSCPSADGAAAIVFGRAAEGHPLAWLVAGRTESGRLLDVADEVDTLSRRTASTAFDAAGMGPEDLDVVEVHDAFTIGE